MISFPATPTIDIWFPFFSPTYIQDTKEQSPGAEVNTLFLDCHLSETSWLRIAGHQLAKDSLSWNNCKRREKSSKGFLQSVGVGA